MSDDQPQNGEPPKAPLPVCPYCNADPMQFSRIGFNFPPTYHAQVIYCANPDCRKVITIQIVAELPQAIQPARGPIIMPGHA